jgi:hypothetical protein
MPTPTPPPIAVARAVVGAPAAADREAQPPCGHGLPSVVLTLYRQKDGDGTYSIVMHRGASEGRR